MSQPTELHELSVTRHIAASPETVWEIMVDRLTEWWCPKPWTTEIVDVEWRNGGSFRVKMKGPEEGQEENIPGVFLEVVPERRMVFTDAVTPDWKPSGPFMVGILEIEPEGDGTRYTGRARHWTAEAHQQHEEMGFEEGWSAVADQLAALAEGE